MILSTNNSHLLSVSIGIETLYFIFLNFVLCFSCSLRKEPRSTDDSITKKKMLQIQHSHMSHVKKTAINIGLAEQKLDGIMSYGSLTFIEVFGYISSLKNQGFEA